MPVTTQRSGEFDLIARHFARVPAAASGVALGVGDDCALLEGGPDRQWAVTTDMLVEGVHFLPDVEAASLGHKALAVNLSDLAACGAQPRCCFLALALPQIDDRWLADFSRGLFALAERWDCALAGGDTTRSAQGRVICITALGELPRGAALLRSGARAGDELWVSGTLGDGALGLACRQGRLDPGPAAALAAIERLERPEPRIELGLRLRGVASAAIDVSDGLAGDLGHLLERSGVAATVDWASLPRSPGLCRLPLDVQQRCVFEGGDDYELLFAAAPERADAVRAAAVAAGVAVSRIGVFRTGRGLRVVLPDGRTVDRAPRAFDHFRP